MSNASIDKAVLELFKIHFQMLWRIWSEIAAQAHVPIHVHPLEMHRVDGILLTLKPIARNFGEYDLAEPILPGERFPIRNEWSGLRSEVSPNQSSALRDRIRFDPHLVFELRVGSGGVVIGLFDATARFIKAPAVVITAQPAGLVTRRGSFFQRASVD